MSLLTTFILLVLQNAPKCFFIPNNVKAKVIGAGYVGTNVINIMSALKTFGALSVALQVTLNFQHYS